jgi:hypothetical protein
MCFKKNCLICILTRRDHPSLFYFLARIWNRAADEPRAKARAVHPRRRRLFHLLSPTKNNAFKSPLNPSPQLPPPRAASSQSSSSPPPCISLRSGRRRGLLGCPSYPLMASEGAVSRRPPLAPPAKRRAASGDHHPSNVLTYKRRRGKSNSISGSDPKTTVHTHSPPSLFFATIAPHRWISFPWSKISFLLGSSSSFCCLGFFTISCLLLSCNIARLLET